MSWERAGKLYRQAREGNHSAYQELYSTALPQLARWLCARRPGALASWEFEEVAESAFIVTALRWSSIPSWSQAWVFAQRVAARLAIRVLERRLHSNAVDYHNYHYALDIEDGSASHEVEVTDFIVWLEERLAARTPEQLLVFRSVLYGTPSVLALAQQLRVSLATAKRRRRALRTWLSEELLRTEDPDRSLSQES